MCRKSVACCVCSVLALSACGGGSGSEYNNLVSEAQRLSGRLSPLSATTVLPSGSATYQGVVVLADDFDTSASGVVGQANLSANFAASTINGSGSNFYQTGVDTSGNPTPGSGASTPGSLTFAATSIGTLFTLGVDGTVTVDGAPRTISGTALGGFFGPNAEMIAAFGTDLPTTSRGYDVDVAVIAD